MQLILNKRTKNILLLKVAQSQKIFPSSKKRAKSLSSAFLPKENMLRIVVWHIIWRMEQMWKTFWDLGGLHMFKLFALRSRDLSQAEKKVTVVKSEQMHKMKIIFTENDQKFKVEKI